MSMSGNSLFRAGITFFDVLVSWHEFRKRDAEISQIEPALLAAGTDRRQFLELLEQMPRRHLAQLYCRLDRPLRRFPAMESVPNSLSLADDLAWARDLVWLRLSPLEA